MVLVPYYRCIITLVKVAAIDQDQTEDNAWRKFASFSFLAQQTCHMMIIHIVGWALFLWPANWFRSFNYYDRDERIKHWTNSCKHLLCFFLSEIHIALQISCILHFIFFVTVQLSETVNIYQYYSGLYFTFSIHQISQICCEVFQSCVGSFLFIALKNHLCLSGHQCKGWVLAVWLTADLKIRGSNQRNLGGQKHLLAMAFHTCSLYVLYQVWNPPYLFCYAA